MKPWYLVFLLPECSQKVLCHIAGWLAGMHIVQVLKIVSNGCLQHAPKFKVWNFETWNPRSPACQIAMLPIVLHQWSLAISRSWNQFISPAWGWASTHQGEIWPSCLAESSNWELLQQQQLWDQQLLLLVLGQEGRSIWHDHLPVLVVQHLVLPLVVLPWKWMGRIYEKNMWAHCFRVGNWGSRAENLCFRIENWCLNDEKLCFRLEHWGFRFGNLWFSVEIRVLWLKIEVLRLQIKVLLLKIEALGLKIKVSRLKWMS